VPPQIKSVARNGNDIALAWTSGVPPFSIESRASLSGGLWSIVVSNILTFSATVTNGISGSTGFFRVSGH
jgi:S1-C subfamily serine protease